MTLTTFTPIPQATCIRVETGLAASITAKADIARHRLINRILRYHLLIKIFTQILGAWEIKPAY